MKVIRIDAPRELTDREYAATAEDIVKHITKKEYEAIADLILETKFGESISTIVELETDEYFFVVRFVAEVYYDMDEIPEGKFRYIRSLACVGGVAQVFRTSDMSFEEISSDFDANELAKYIIGECH